MAGHHAAAVQCAGHVLVDGCRLNQECPRAGVAPALRAAPVGGSRLGAHVGKLAVAGLVVECVRSASAPGIAAHQAAVVDGVRKSPRVAGDVGVVDFGQSAAAEDESPGARVGGVREGGADHRAGVVHSQGVTGRPARQDAQGGNVELGRGERGGKQPPQQTAKNHCVSTEHESSSCGPGEIVALPALGARCRGGRSRSTPGRAAKLNATGSILPCPCENVNTLEISNSW